MLGAVLDRSATASGVTHGDVLLDFVDAALGDDAAALSTSRETARRALGDAAFVDACATIASFNAVVKIADGTGIALEDAKAERTTDLRAELGIDALKR